MTEYRCEQAQWQHARGSGWSPLHHGGRRAYPTYLLRRSFRDEHGRPRKETLANLTGLPEESIAALRATLKGRTPVDAETAFEVQRSVPHGDAAAAHVMAGKLGLRELPRQ